MLNKLTQSVLIFAKNSVLGLLYLLVNMRFFYTDVNFYNLLITNKIELK